ncbi:nitroreductase family protein [Nitrospina watsonii]|uniref:Nitroreductase domain-containing protein n=1 Tax=Nitrospina watsonii TaxID=1323948 RepID=A0ABN8W0Y4_9BACT|nr:nitroreductase family protein [Nitrospina watsonii]CAI2718103.1 conserved protein of unknown function [Nitrospina watsonii]
MSRDAVKSTISYHQRTKHHFNQLARGPGHLDWATQPNPFRRYEQAPLVYLPPVVADDSPPYHKIFEADAIPPRPLNADSISRFFELSLAVSAWKQAGDNSWALRSNPSSGNLHPTEGYAVLDAMAGIGATPGVYHYAPKEHGLERRAELMAEQFQSLLTEFPDGTFLAGLTSIHWREAWKYGERAFRYCQHDIGHALAAYRIAAAVLGWKLVLLEDMDDASIATLFGIDRDDDFSDAEREHPDLVVAVFTQPVQSLPQTRRLPGEALAGLCSAKWVGQANRLSPDHREWPVINEVAESSLKNETGTWDAGSAPFTSCTDWLNADLSLRQQRVTARQIIRQRRSAVAFDGITGMSRDAFYKTLAQTIQPLPADAVPWQPGIHFCLYVHRVDGLPPGVYFFLRDLQQLQRVKAITDPGFLWKKPEACPDELPLYVLSETNVQRQAAQVSCTQEIAGQSAFSLGMIADFDNTLQQQGAWYYRRLFWEAGMVGQMLYLAAEYMGLRATGIGCYFDDPVHEILRLRGNAFQSLYHFTLGGAVEDKRLTTHPAYAWSCDLVESRFAARPGGAESNACAERTRTLPDAACVEWHGKRVSRIGAGLKRFGRIKRQHQEAMDALLQSTLNVIETSPDESEGEDQVVLGNALNRRVNADEGGAEGVFVIAGIGLAKGRHHRLLQDMEQRGRAFPDVISLGTGRAFCMHPEFLKDQIDRSLRRSGLPQLDLAILRLPENGLQALGAEACRQQVRRAFLYLQEECDRGHIGGFGIACPLWLDPENVMKEFSLETVYAGNKDLKGFQAVEFAANFIHDQAVVGTPEVPSLLERARGLGLKTLCGTPLRAVVEGEDVLLVDYPPCESENREAKWDWVLDELKELETRIHLNSMADGRNLKEVLEQASIPSPFKFRDLIEPVRHFQPQHTAQLNEALDQIQQIYFRARSLGEQIVQARLWDPVSFDEMMDTGEQYFSWIAQDLKIRFHQESNSNVALLRSRYFADAPETIPLQVLGVQWLLGQGVDVVLSGMTQAGYVKEAETLLKALS